MTANQINAVRLLNVYTAGRFDVYLLAGPAKASVRAHIMSELKGIRIPQAKAGVNSIREELFILSGAEGSCLAAREDNLAAWAKSILSGDLS